MNISSEISSIHQINASGYFLFNASEVETYFQTFLVVHIICFLSFPINSYVIWLIIRGTGNGLAAEFFLLNFCVCEMLLCLNGLLIFLNYKVHTLWIVVAFIDGLVVTGRPLFECLICVERYLAVVHPVMFLKYKPLRYRLMCSAVSWVAIFASGGFNVIIWLFSYALYMSYLIAVFLIFFSIELFCCVAVLRALKQSGPGERGREREEENRMKRRAFYLILITTVTTVIIYTPYTIIAFLLTAERNKILYFIAVFCFASAGWVQPVLFLYRVGKLDFRCQFICK